MVSLLPESPVFCLLSVLSTVAVLVSRVVISAQADGSLVELIHCGPHMLTWLVAVSLGERLRSGARPFQSLLRPFFTHPPPAPKVVWLFSSLILPS